MARLFKDQYGRFRTEDDSVPDTLDHRRFTDPPPPDATWDDYTVTPAPLATLDDPHHYPDDHRIKFKFRAKTIGTEWWLCPLCGHLNRTQLRGTTYKVRCQSRNGCVTFPLGRTLYLPPNGRHYAPGDIAIPQHGITLAEAFPEGDVYRWISGTPLHRILKLKADIDDAR